eukprot:5804829-Pyramimonas_sp.AAC.1
MHLHAVAQPAGERHLQSCFTVLLYWPAHLLGVLRRLELAHDAQHNRLVPRAEHLPPREPAVRRAA